ncbi:MAG TPA: thiamine diphosphokinase, partial [Candidatus Eisenbacteria bacterium]|nr:thiamine diphosphokinase [Candidatus Eisenbacteria bacterium]
MNIVIFTGGEFIKSNLTQKAIQEADMILAADSGAEYALQNNIYPSAVLGDLDSISASTKVTIEKHGTQFVNLPTTLLSNPNRNPHDSQEKDQTDTELAVQYAIEQGAKKITLLGGNSGDRFDHVIANLLLTATISVPTFF